MAIYLDPTDPTSLLGLRRTRPASAGSRGPAPPNSCVTQTARSVNLRRTPLRDPNGLESLDTVPFSRLSTLPGQPPGLTPRGERLPTMAPVYKIALIQLQPKVSQYMYLLERIAPCTR